MATPVLYRHRGAVGDDATREATTTPQADTVAIPSPESDRATIRGRGEVRADPGGSRAAQHAAASAERRAVGGGAWTLLQYGLQNALRLGGNLLLTRLLFPEAFGVMAIVNVVIQGLWLFTDVGITPAVVHSERGDDPRFLNTAWTIQVVRGALLFLVTLLLAGPVAGFYAASDPLAAELVWFLPVAGLTTIIDGARSTKLLTLRRHLDLKTLAVVEIGCQAVGLAFMVAMAVVHASIWALVVGGVVTSALRLVVSHLCLPGVRNRLAWEGAAARSLFHFGRWVFVSTMLTFMAGQLDRLLFGRLVSFELLGVYGIALALASMPSVALLRLGTSVVFPLLSRLQGDPDAFAAAFYRLRRPVIILAGGLVAGLLPAGPALVDGLYDSRYSDAGWMLQLLLLGAWAASLTSPSEAALLALGRTGALAAGNAVKLVAMCVGLPLGFWLWGLGGGIAALAVAEVLRWGALSLWTRCVGLRQQGPDLLATLFLACTLLLGVLVARSTVADAAPPLVSAVVAGLAGGLPWGALAVAWWLRRERER